MTGKIRQKFKNSENGWNNLTLFHESTFRLKPHQKVLNVIKNDDRMMKEVETNLKHLKSELFVVFV